MKILDFLSGTSLIYETDSPINGHLVVKKDLAWGTYIVAEGLTQSGGIVESIWKKTLLRIYNLQFTISNCLILGLGGGSVAKVIRKNWVDSKITGVDIDPMMVNLGTRYLGLGTSKTKVVIEDAYDFCKTSPHRLVPSTYDLVCIDLYNGDQFPKKFEEEKFLKALNKKLSKKGTAIFNRLYYGDKRGDAVRFLKKLERNFKNVEAFYPEANVMYICRNG